MHSGLKNNALRYSQVLSEIGEKGILSMFYNNKCYICCVKD